MFTNKTRLNFYSFLIGIIQFISQRRFSEPCFLADQFVDSHSVYLPPFPTCCFCCQHISMSTTSTVLWGLCLLHSFSWFAEVPVLSHNTFQPYNPQPRGASIYRFIRYLNVYGDFQTSPCALAARPASPPNRFVILQSGCSPLVAPTFPHRNAVPLAS